MKSSKVASRYAKALLEIAIEQGKVDSVLGDMKFLLEINKESRDFEMLIQSPIVNPDKKIAIFELIFEQFEEVSMAFLKLITKNRREDVMPEIAEAFSALVMDHKGIVAVSLISATPLDAETKAAITKKVQGMVSGQLEIEERIDESLIGGFIVRMGDTQIDASVSSQFNKLKQLLTR
jgi:F-type H+-transporting ATPase subunit delta